MISKLDTIIVRMFKFSKSYYFGGYYEDKENLKIRVLRMNFGIL